MDWILALWLMGNLVSVEGGYTEQSCHAAGQAPIASKRADTYHCGPRRIYRPKSAAWRHAN